MFELKKMLILIGLFRMLNDMCSKTNLRPNGGFKENIYCTERDQIKPN